MSELATNPGSGSGGSSNPDFLDDPALVLYLPLYDLEGDSFTSADAYGHSCTVIGGALLQANGRYFDGWDDHIAIDSPTSIVFPPDEFSCLGWIKPSETVTGSVLSYKGQTGGLDINIYGSKLRMTKINIAHCVTSTADISTSQFTHFACLRHTDNDWEIYLNGESDATNNNNNTITEIGFSQIGWGEYSKFSGLIGELLIYNRALTPEEIQQIYDATKLRYP